MRLEIRNPGFPMHRRGTLLIAVLVFMALASMVAAGLMFRMRAEASTAAATDAGHQSYLAAMSGIERAMALIAASSQEIDLSDDEDLLRDQLVADDGANKWYFTVCASDGERAKARFGLDDEAGKININTASPEMLTALLGLVAPDRATDELVDCLIDYRDGDSDARPHGAEQDQYTYAIANGMFKTLEELLLVKGFDARIVFGEDANLNGILDPNESDGEATFPPDNGDSVLNVGLYHLATVGTIEPNVDNAGAARININGAEADLGKLARAGLPKQTVDFITAYRKDGNVFTHPSQLLEMQYQLKNPQNNPNPGNPGDTGRPGRRPRGNPGNAGQPIPGQQPAQQAAIFSGVGAEQLDAVMDKLSILPAAPQPGLVNVNTAPLEVLGLIPGIDQTLGQSIIDARGGLEASRKTTTAWLFGENLVDAQKFKQIAPYLTARSFQYRIRCVGYGVPCGQFRVLEAVISRNSGQPRIVYLRDVTNLGLPTGMGAGEK